MCVASETPGDEPRQRQNSRRQTEKQRAPQTFPLWASGASCGPQTGHPRLLCCARISRCLSAMQHVAADWCRPLQRLNPQAQDGATGSRTKRRRNTTRARNQDVHEDFQKDRWVNRVEKTRLPAPFPGPAFLKSPNEYKSARVLSGFGDETALPARLLAASTTS